MPVLGKLAAGASVTATAVYQPLLLAWTCTALLAGVLLIILGVVLPAVWSRKRSRRCAAAALVGQLLAATRRSR